MRTLLLLVVGGSLFQGAAPNPRTDCQVPRVASESPRTHAQRCAEDFIRRNGYTAAAPTVTERTIAYETITIAGSWREVLAFRRNSLRPSALGVCSGSRRDSLGFTVVFRYRDTAIGDARAVTMNRTFNALRVEHEDFSVAVVDSARLGCARVAARDRPGHQLRETR
jgi:hypothetical protein